MPSENMFETDTFQTTKGPLVITFIGHGSLMLKWNGMILHVDPFGRQADYGLLPKADIILLTHEHGDHMDMSVLNKIVSADTQMVYTRRCEQQAPGGSS
jgi:L-ascorbate metabolism protein UlaG (beta-lactamase superfamily)